MAGRPKTMVKKLAEVEEAAFALSESLANMRPPVPVERQNAEGSPGRRWCEACLHAEEAAMALGELLAILEKKARLPWESLQREREQRRGVLPEEAGAEGACAGELNSARATPESPACARA